MKIEKTTNHSTTGHNATAEAVKYSITLAASKNQEGGVKMKKITKYDVKLVKEECKLYDLQDTVIDSSKKAGEAIQMICDIHNSAVEKFGMLCLNARHEIVGVHIIHVGGINESVVDPRAVFQRALLNNATSLILFHNHPSGSPQPSQADVISTQKLKAAGATLDIKVLDHIIVYGDDKYTSMAESMLI